jgi:hypothetical protein
MNTADRPVMVIAGGTGSIGKETARQALEAGWRVVLHHAALPWLVRSGGTLIAFASDAGRFAAPGQSVSAGPYWNGKVSTVTGSLAVGMMSVQALAPVALILLFLAARRLRHETPAGRLTLAEAAGELPAQTR